MKIEQPAAPNSRPKTTNLLALAIYDFEQKAKAFHNEQACSAPKNETPEARKARDNQRKADFAHLQCERTRIRQFAAIQATLEQYKKDNRALSKTDTGIRIHCTLATVLVRYSCTSTAVLEYCRRTGTS